MDATDAALFGCRGVHLTLGGRRILEDVSIAAQAGEVLGVVGPNGAGKTSLFEVLSGRVAANRGCVWLDGRDISRLGIAKRVRAGVGRTFQSPVVPNALPVYDVLRAARKAFHPKLSKLRAEWACEIARLDVRRDAAAGSLDTLQRRKLLLACLLMRRPRVLLMDEPASGLVHSEIDELDEIIRVLAREMCICLLVVEHRLELLGAIADRVTVLDLGKVIAGGEPATVFADPAVRAAYFDA